MNLQNFLRKTAVDYICFWIPVVVFLAVFVSYLHYIPLWDGRAYFNNCILPGVANPFHLLAFNCTNHGALFYGIFYALLQYISFGNVLFIHLTSLFLMLATFCFLYSILKILFVDKKWIMLGMAMICWNPVIVANVINPTPDL